MFWGKSSLTPLLSVTEMVFESALNLLTCRLRGVMEKIVSLNQCSFVPRRHNIDNISITQEVVRTMKNRRGKKGWMTIKIDLEK